MNDLDDFVFVRVSQKSVHEGLPTHFVSLSSPHLTTLIAKANHISYGWHGSPSRLSDASVAPRVKLLKHDKDLIHKQHTLLLAQVKNGLTTPRGSMNLA
jgi:hypothetical protein